MGNTSAPKGDIFKKIQINIHLPGLKMMESVVKNANSQPGKQTNYLQYTVPYAQ